MKKNLLSKNILSANAFNNVAPVFSALTTRISFFRKYYSLLIILAFVLGLSDIIMGQTVTTITATGTWTVPAGVTSVTVYTWGGGGGAGGSSTGAWFANGGGGGGGEMSSSVLSVTAGQIYTVTVGAGGTGGTSGTVNGGLGGTTTFTGTGGTVTAVGGAGGTASAGVSGATIAGGAGGLATAGAGTTRYAGGTGSSGKNGTSSTTGVIGIGGGGAGSGGPGTSPATACASVGTGGIGTYPGGLGGKGANCGNSTNTVGVVGAIFGGGGGGANDYTTSTLAGGAGGAGRIVLVYTVSCTAPTTQASIGSYTNNTSGTGVSVNWTNGTGTATIVVGRLTATALATPANATAYTANTVFGSGSAVGSGNFVVYNGTGTSVDVTGLTSAASYTFTVYSLTAATNCYLTPGSSSAVTIFTLPTTLVLSSGSNSVTCGTSTYLYDHAGALADYSNSVSGYTVLNNAGTGVITINGTYQTESGYDYLRIYSGVGTGTLLFSYSGTGTIPTFTSTAGQTITIGFSSDGSGTGLSTTGGFALTAIYSGSCALPAPTISSFTPASGCQGSNVVITGTNFSGITGVTFGGVAAASYVVNSTTQITAVPAATATGTIAVTNSGGTATSAATYTVSPLPVAAGTITGTATVCQGASGVSYSVPAITNATSYTWAYSGTGATITGSTNSVTIAFSASATGGNLTVWGTNTCGSGTVSAAYAITVTPTVAAASTPSPATAATGVCYAGGGSVSSVSWTAAAGATSYAVYFGAGSLPGSITSTVATTSYSTGTLLASTTYYWKVVPINSCGSYGSPVTWTFTTASSPCALVYCASAATSTADEEIYSVTVNGATNALGCGVAAPGAGSVAYLYSNFTTIGALTSVTPGQTVSFSIAENECDGATYYTNGCAIWIDYNQNGLFTDAGEQVYTESGLLSSPRTIASSFVVPAGATIGTTRMRITVAEGYSGSTLTPCLSYSFGETEDYNITISNAPVISSFSPKTGCTIGASNVTITGVNMASATSVTFNGVAGTIVSNSATSIVVTPPSGVTTGDIIVTTAGGSGTSATPYAVVSFTAPTVANTGGGCSSTALNLTANGLAPGSGGVTLASASSQYLITPDLASFSTTKDITLEIWFKANAAGVIISEQGAAPLNAGWHDSQLEILASGEVKVSVWAGASSPVSIGTVSFGTWNHAVVRYNSATSKLDGLLNGVPSVPVTITRATPNSASPFFTNLYYGIGNVDATAITGGTGAYFDGQVDEFRVWNTALSTANIDSWMTREVTASHPNYANLVAYYKMNTGAMLVDSKTGTYPLTAVASPVSTVSSYYTYSWAGPSGATNPTASTLETQAGNTGSGAFPQTWTLTTTSPLGCTIPTTTTTNSLGTASTAPTSASVSPASYCLAPATITLTATGGSPGAGAVLTWTSGSCGGTVVGTGSPLTITAPSATTTYYAKYVSCVGTTLCVSTTVTLSPLAAPTAGTASPSSICAGATANLSAISAGNYINWYNASSGGTLLNSSPIASGGTFAVTPSTTPTTYYAQAVSISAGTPTTTTFNYSGSIVNWTVPAGVSSITVAAKGAQGGSNVGTGGLGASTQGTFAVTSGQVLSILVGQQPPNNYSFAAGGGGTFVANGASYSTATPLIVAGGGGGSASGTGQAGQILNVTTTGDGGGPLPGTNGNGAASTSCGGGGGGFYTSGGNDVLTSPSFIAYGGAGFRQGGAGGSGGTSYSTGGFGGGASPNYYGSCNMEAGAGGGYSGGSAQNSGSTAYTGYGGGSYNSGTAQTNSSGTNSGNGIVTITYTSVIVNCVSSVLTPVTVTVNQYPVISAQPVAPAAFCAASTATASVTATGAVSYQWQANGVNISGAPYSGYSSNTLTITNPTSADNGAVITCVITGAGGCATTSSSFTIVVNTTPAAPTGVTASSSTICEGQSVNLSATVSTGSINWYNSTGTLIGSTASGANLPVSPTTTTTYQAEATSAVVGSATFNYTGAIQTYTVPAGVTLLHMQVVGAQGGNTSGYTPLGGSGAKMEGDITVTPGQVLKVLAGGQGVQGTTSSGGGGGGGSFVTTSTNAPLIIAGGGGGVAVSTSVYTPVGADAVTTTSGVNGYSGLGGTPGNYGIGGTAGSGATGGTSCGGNGGGLLSNGIANASCCTGTYGYGFVNGAAGGTVCVATGNGGFGGGGGGGNTAGGGGGGYSGGGASWNNPTNGGGGGSYNAGSNQVNTAGFNASGNGYVVISYTSGAGCLSTQVPVTVTVNPIPAVSITSASPVAICSGSSTLLSATGATTYTWMPGSLTGSDVTVSPTSATTYTVTGSSSGCNGPTQTVSVTVNANPVILSATASPNPVCAGNILDLATTTTTTATSYVVSSIPYGFIPPGFFGLSPTTVYTAPSGPDDGVTSGVTLPFTFTYYGVPYTSINISSNGNIQFSSALTTWTPSTIPTVGGVDNFVGGPMMDLNFSTGTGTLNYVTYGSAPNRVFIIAWENVTIYGTSDLETSEIMLYEADNSIETHIGGAGINAPALVKAIGIEGPGGTAGLAAPARNASTWVTTLNESYRFALNSLTYSWAGPNSFTSSIANPSLTTSTASAGTYSVTVTDIFGCTASATTAAVVINSATAPTATNAAQCGPGIPTCSVTSTVGSGGEFYWYNAATSGTLVQAPPLSTYYTNTFASSATPATLSGVAAITGGVCRLHTNTTSQQGGITVPASGFSTVQLDVQFDATTSGTAGNMADGFSYSFAPNADATLSSYGQEQGTGSKLRISFDAYGSSGANMQGIYLLYNQTGTSFNPTLGGAVLGYSGNTSWLNSNKHYAITINTSGQLTLVVGGVTIFSNVQLPADYLTANKATWKHVIAGRTGGSSMQTDIDNLVIQLALSGSTTFLSSISGTTTWYVSETATNGCISPLTAVTETVNPIPTVTTASTATSCSGTATNISLTSSVASSFTWTVGTITGTISGASAGSGTTIAQTLTNPSSSVAGTVQYLVTPTSSTGACLGNPYTITVTVNPAPTVTTANTATICSGNATSISLAATVTSSFTWTVGTITGSITGASAGSGGTIGQTLTNPSASAAGTVEYIVTPTATTGTCAGSAYTITVTVNPKPTVTTPNTASICSGTATAISLTASGSSTFAWTIGTITGSISGASPGSGTTIAQTLTNPSSSAAGTVQYIVTPTASTGGCAGSAYTITVTVTPTPAITCPSAITVAAGAGSCTTTVTYTATSTTPGTTITYSIPSGSAFTVGTTSVTATATTAAGCTSTCTFTVTVTSSGTSNWIGGTSTDWFTAANWCGGVPTSTSNVSISSGATYMPLIATTGAVCRNLTLNTGATLTMNGTAYLTVYGNWLNSGTFTATAGDVSFAGTTAQTLTGATTFFNFTLNNATGLTSSSNITINGLGQLTAGVLTSGANIVIISSGANLLVTTGYVNGYLRKSVDVGAAITASFEVGSATAYTPTTLYFNSVSTAGTLTVNTVSTDHGTLSASGFNATHTINRYWNVVKAGGLAFDYYDLEVNYATADMDAGFSPTYAGAKIYVTSTTCSTNDYGANYASANHLDFVGITEIGAIQIGVFNPTPVVSFVTPDYAYIGTTSNLVVHGEGFIASPAGSTVNSMAGVTINSTTVNSDTTLTLNITVSPTATLGARSFAVTNPTPFGGVSDSLTITIRKKPVPMFYPNRTTVGCYVDGTVEFVNYTTDAVSYLWNFGAGATPATATGFGPYTVSYSTTGYKTITLTAYSPIGDSTLVRTNYINVTNVAPVIPASIAGPTTVCSSGPNKIYSVPLVSGVTSYTWTVPTGATVVSGSGTRTLTVSFSPTYATGTITVKQVNGCGESPIKSLVVTGLSPVPASITGPTNICTLTSATYTVSAVVGATSYTWSLPTGVTTSTGASTTTTTGTTLTVYFVPGAAGNIEVYSTNICSSSASISLYVSGTSTLVTPTALSGPINTCGLTSGTYTVSAVTGATGYQWTLPAGVTSTAGTSPITTTGTSLTVSYNTVGSGTISVIAINTCATSAAKTLAFTNSAPLATPATLTGPTSTCGLTTGTYTVSAVSGATGYEWTLPSGVTSTAGVSPITTSGTTLTVSYNTVGSGTISVIAKTACVTSGAKTIAFTNSINTPASVTGPTNICGITSGTYTVSAITGATGYVWTLPTGVTSSLGSSPITTSVNTITVDYATGLTSGTIDVAATNGCVTTPTVSIAFIMSGGTAPATPGVITGPTAVCSLSSATYSIVAVAGATSYTWTLPSGITSSAGISPFTTTLTSIPVSFASFTSGSISVTANSCSASAARTLALTTVPAVPATLTGTTVLCGASSQTYTVAAVTGATDYIWTLPTGITSGGLSIVTIPAATAPATNTITVDVAGSFASGIINVKSSNACGASINKALSLSTTPLTPGVITGPTVACGLTSATYSIVAVSGATSYTWTLPAGFTLASGSTGLSNSITVDIASFTTGTLSVVANGDCGTSVARTLAISNSVAIPASLTGPLMVCGLTTATYTVAATSGAASYTWTLPTGVTSALGASPVTVTAVTTGTNTIVLTFDTTFVSGTLSVTANTSCGSSGLRSIALNRTTTTPTTLIGSTLICGLSSVTYTVSAVSGATGYTWTLPAGASSGGVYSSITTSGLTLPVTFDSTFTFGTLSVVSNSPSCGSSAPKSLVLSTAPITPVTLSGATNICNLSSSVYTVSATTGAVSYTWTLPSGVTSGGLSTVTIPAATAPATNTITVNFAATSISGSIAVTANSACASSAPKTLTFIGTTAPATPAAISGSTIVCPSTSGTYTATAVAGAISYTWTLPAGVTSGGLSTVTTSSNSILLDFGAAFVSGSISVKANNHCTTSAVARALALTTVIGTAGVITGPTVVCGLTSATYTVAATVGAVSYTWTLPAGITTIAGASPVTITGSNTITVDFGTFTSGSLSVKANSACASSVTARTLALSKLAATPGVITGPTNVCGVATATYSVVAVSGATGYKWTVPVDLTILSGQGTNSITVSIVSGPGATLSNYTLSVRDTNACGQSTARSLTIQNCHEYSAFSADSSAMNNVETLLYPNPSLGTFNIEYNSEIKSQLRIEMYDVLGKLVFQQLETIVEGQNVFRFNEEGVQKGSYFIKLTDEKNNMKQTKILIVQ